MERALVPYRPQSVRVLFNFRDDLSPVLAGHPDKVGRLKTPLRIC